MRIEQKPDNPSPLSIRQLMRELKEGIKIAILQRERTIRYIETAVGENYASYDKNIAAFDSSLQSLFEIYLEYFEKWALLHQNSYQKNLLEDEWKFCSLVVGNITDGKVVADKTFCTILCTLLNVIGERLLGRIDEFVLDVQSKERDDINRRLFIKYVVAFVIVLN